MDVPGSISQAAVDQLEAGVTDTFAAIQANLVAQIFSESLPLLGDNLAAAAGDGTQALLHITGLANAITAGLILGIFGMLMGGTGTFKQVFAILAHGGVITALQILVSMPLSYATGRLAGFTLDALVPTLEETSFLTRFLGGLDLFWMWWCLSIAIGVGVLFKRRTGGIATTFLATYVVVVLVYALLRSGS